MSAEPSQATPSRPPRAKAVLLEGVLVAVLGAVLSFGANAISPRGLALARNYFPGAIRKPLPAVATSPSTPGSATNPAPSIAELALARLKAKDLRPADLAEMQRLFHDPRCGQQLVVFIDARDDQHYRAGHIPGAHLFDHYRAEKYLASVLPVCQAAEQIVIYCLGGDCEDSEFAAVTLREVGVPNAKLSVSVGGFTEWATNALPVEVGERNSGNLRSEKK